MNDRFTRYQQTDRSKSPRPSREPALQYFWEWIWLLACYWTPKPLNSWRLLWLRLFGAQVDNSAFVHPRARIEMPWNLSMKQRSCLGDRTHVYALDTIEIGAGATVCQEAYLCTGTHDLEDLAMSLITGPIIIGRESFIGARAFVLPGTIIGDGAVVGACAVVTRDVEPWIYAVGNPCRSSGKRRRLDVS